MNIAIGKYTLESLTSGMYNTPMVLYREYIQNAIDAIDDAIDRGILELEKARVVIDIDSDNRRITIEDNGSGVRLEDAETQLFGIGNSNKAAFKRRGFRGIGRWVGIGYADKLSFYTSYAGEPFATIVSIDCTTLRQILIPGQYEDYGLVDALEHVIRRTQFAEKPEKHYFRVVLDGISDNEEILDYNQVKDYICQTAPLPYDSRTFSWGAQIETACAETGHPLSHYAIFLKHTDSEEEQLYKLYCDRFLVNMSKHQVDQLQDIGIHRIQDESGVPTALVWYGKSRFLGTILDDKIKGIRFREGNILIGGRSSLNHIFREERFNGWFQGEVFVFDSGVIPNARRDDFEQSNEYQLLLSKLYSIGNDLSKEIRQISSSRNRITESAYDKIRIISKQAPEAITKYPQINLCSKLSNSEKRLLEKVFEALESNTGQSATLKKAILAKINEN